RFIIVRNDCHALMGLEDLRIIITPFSGSAWVACCRKAYRPQRVNVFLPFNYENLDGSQDPRQPIKHTASSVHIPSAVRFSLCESFGLKSDYIEQMRAFFVHIAICGDDLGARIPCRSAGYQATFHEPSAHSFLVSGINSGYEGRELPRCATLST